MRYGALDIDDAAEKKPKNNTEFWPRLAWCLSIIVIKLMTAPHGYPRRYYSIVKEGNIVIVIESEIAQSVLLRRQWKYAKVPGQPPLSFWYCNYRHKIWKWRPTYNISSNINSNQL